ncbi:hypothetical protein H6G04_32540 [Calothrix membranacea FACHB-236]|nr:hypothetical protein [Calothrix membranacea FACHB-236]
MANINVNDLLNLNLHGVELFNDSESFLIELSDESQAMEVIGGCCCCPCGTCKMNSDPTYVTNVANVAN